MRAYAAILALALGACGADTTSMGLDAGTGATPAHVTSGAGGTGACLSPSAVTDRDGDFRNNAAALADPALCITEERFEEGGTWQLQIIRNTRAPGRVLWVVPHDNENAAFTSAVYGVRRFGGTVVAVETGGARNNGSQDPNRNFDVGNGGKCPQQRGPSPVYTSHVMALHASGAPIVALHTNSPGPPIQVSHPPANVRAFPAPSPIGNPPDDAVVFVASTSPPEANGAMQSTIAALNRSGINVFYEMVSAANNDCSLSNYAALKGIPNYFNLEVAHGDGATQRKMVDILMSQLGIGG